MRVVAQASRLWFHRRDAGATETSEPVTPQLGV